MKLIHTVYTQCIYLCTVCLLVNKTHCLYSVSIHQLELFKWMCTQPSCFPEISDSLLCPTFKQSWWSKRQAFWKSTKCACEADLEPAALFLGGYNKLWILDLELCNTVRDQMMHQHTIILFIGLIFLNIFLKIYLFTVFSLVY